MKKLILAFTALFTMTVTANAMSYEQARRQALFLTDKMAYELNLTEDQYEAAYEINLDYLMGVNSYDDIYGAYWTQRNLDLSYILLSWQYQAFLDATYFYRPLYWDAGYWHFAIYARYPYRDYFYFGCPRFYTVYRGNHSWRHNGGRSWYYNRDMRPRDGHNFSGMRDGFERGNYGNGYSRNGNGTFGRNNNGNNGTFGRGNNGNNGTFGRGNNGNNGTFGRGNNGNNGGSNSGRTTTVTQRNNGSTLGANRRKDDDRAFDRMSVKENVATPNIQENNTNTFRNTTIRPTRESSTRTTVRSNENGSRFGSSRSGNTTRNFSAPSQNASSRYSAPSNNSRSMGNSSFGRSNSSSPSSRSSMGSNAPVRSSSSSSSFSRGGSFNNNNNNRSGGGSFGSRR